MTLKWRQCFCSSGALAATSSLPTHRDLASLYVASLLLIPFEEEKGSLLVDDLVTNQLMMAWWKVVFWARILSVILFLVVSLKFNLYTLASFVLVLSKF